MLQDLPRFLVSFAKRFVTGSYASTHSVPSSPKSSNSTEPLSRDTFGFRQIIVAGTASGKVFGIDSSNGEIVWSRVFGLGWAIEVGGRVLPVKLFVTKTAADGGDPEVVIVAQRRADNVRLLYTFTSLRQCSPPAITDFSRHDHLPFEC
jgi:outer membrane protein assembly factor BamB